MPDLNVLHRGDKGDAVRALQAATNRRLRTRDLAGLAVREDGQLGPATLVAVRKAAWALGALKATYDPIPANGAIPVGVQRMIRNPGLRNADQRERGKARLSNMRHDRQRAAHVHDVSQGRLHVVHNCLVAAANYRARPGAYHYLAGGRANLVYLTPTPSDWRSDCSQFASSVQHDAGLADLGPNGPYFVNTVIMAEHLEATDSPLPADFGMYGPRNAPHHVEVFCGQAGGVGHEFVGHGSPPIDSLTPGRPDFYLRNPLA